MRCFRPIRRVATTASPLFGGSISTLPEWNPRIAATNALIRSHQIRECATDAAATLEKAKMQIVFSCSMCDKVFRLQSAADMHNISRHQGQATITNSLGDVMAVSATTQQLRERNEKGGPSGPLHLSGGGSGIRASVGVAALPAVGPVPAPRIPTPLQLNDGDVVPFDSIHDEAHGLCDAVLRQSSLPLSQPTRKISPSLTDGRAIRRHLQIEAATIAGGTTSPHQLEERSAMQMALDADASTPDEVSLAVHGECINRIVLVGEVVAIEEGPDPAKVQVQSANGRTATSDDAVQFTVLTTEQDTGASVAHFVRIAKRALHMSTEVPDIGSTVLVRGRLQMVQRFHDETSTNWSIPLVRIKDGPLTNSITVLKKGEETGATACSIGELEVA